MFIDRCLVLENGHANVTLIRFDGLPTSLEIIHVVRRVQRILRHVRNRILYPVERFQMHLQAGGNHKIIPALQTHQISAFYSVISSYVLPQIRHVRATLIALFTPEITLAILGRYLLHAQPKPAKIRVLPVRVLLRVPSPSPFRVRYGIVRFAFLVIQQFFVTAVNKFWRYAQQVCSDGRQFALLRVFGLKVITYDRFRRVY